MFMQGMMSYTVANLRIVAGPDPSMLSRTTTATVRIRHTARSHQRPEWHHPGPGAAFACTSAGQRRPLRKGPAYFARISMTATV
jgi:hypothetical protein